MGLDLRKLIKECVTQVLREELEEPLYVEYVSERPGENPFMLHGKKFQYVNAKYPDGKIDVGVYAFAGDMVYAYNAFRTMMGIQEGFDPTSVGPNPEASEGLSDGNPYAAWNAKMRQMEGAGPLELTATGEEDDWNRPIYRGADGKVYVDVNLGNGEPSIHSVTDSGEPLSPVTNVKISGGTTNKFPNALCPRCKNSDPKRMKMTPGGKMSCTSCHWQDNPGEPYKGPLKEWKDEETAYENGNKNGRFDREYTGKFSHVSANAGYSPNQRAYSTGYVDGYKGIHKNHFKKPIGENEHGRYAQDAGAVYNDGFDEFRKEIGEKKVNEFLAKFGLGPDYKPSKPKMYECPQCKKHQAQYKEMHADTDMNEMVLECPDCGEQ